MKQDISARFSIENFDDFTYAKKSHWDLFKGLDVELYDEVADPDADVLKRYQDLLILLFIKTYVPKGSRILEVGGGLSRILEHLNGDYECWNADKFEGVGNGPLAPEEGGYKVVMDYVGNFNPELPDNHFDFVFSISALEHVPADDRQFHKNVVDDINRVLKPGGYSLHALDFVINGRFKRQNPFIEFSYEYSNSINSFVPAEEANLDPDFYYMTQKGYEKYWKWLTKMEYADFGMPSNYTVLWQKPLEESVVVEDVASAPAQPEVVEEAMSDDAAPKEEAEAKDGTVEDVAAEPVLSEEESEETISTDLVDSDEEAASAQSVRESEEDAAFFKALSDSYDAMEPESKKVNVQAVEGPGLTVVENGRIAIHWNDADTVEVLDINARPAKVGQAPFDPEPSSINMADREGIDTFYIVTPSFNSEDYIDRTIQSVAMQEGDFFIRYHVQDGGSKDGTVEKLEAWAKEFAGGDSRLVNCRGVEFTFDSAPDKGMYDAISVGIDSIEVPDNGILAWINSDDTFMPGAFSTVHDVMRNNDDAFWILGAVNQSGENSEEVGFTAIQYPPEVVREGLCDGEHWPFIQQEGSFWTGGLWRHVGGVDTTLKLAGDWDLWRRFAMHTSPVHVLWGLGKFRKHEGQLTCDIDKYFEEMDVVVSKDERARIHERLSQAPTRKLKQVRRPDHVNGYKYQFDWLSRDFTPPLFRNKGYAQEFHKRVDEVVKTDTSKPTRVLTFCTLDEGGAATGSRRRIKALRNIGVDARMVTFHNRNHEVPTGRIEPVLDGVLTRNQDEVWRTLFRNLCAKGMNDGFVGHELFSDSDALMNFKQLRPMLGSRDVVHLHWVVGMIDFDTIGEVMKGRPFAWTLADMNAFTGGCHYSEGCSEFMRECRNCPQLGGESDLAHQTWKRKKAAYRNLDIHFVCPSNYIAEMARKSSLVGDKNIHVIPNGYPVDVFVPTDKDAARKELGLPRDKKLVLFGAQSVTNLRKGGDILNRCIDTLNEKYPEFDVEAVFFGEGRLDLPIPSHSMGASDPERLAKIYSAVDVFVSSSREDVGPMTVCESMLCGTPVVSFPIGIMPDFAEHLSTAYFVERFDHEDMADGIYWALGAINSDPEIGNRCRKQAEQYADPEKCAQRHHALYEEMLGFPIETGKPLKANIRKKETKFSLLPNKQKNQAKGDGGTSGKPAIKVVVADPGQPMLVHDSMVGRAMNLPALHKVYRAAPAGVQRLLTRVKYDVILPVFGQTPVTKNMSTVARVGHGVRTAVGLPGQLANRISKGMRYKSDYRIIGKTQLFMARWYLDRYPDVRKSGMDPLKHYVRYGVHENRMPNPFFRPVWYAKKYPEVIRMDINPLVHYIKWGWQSGCWPGPEFNVQRYLDRRPDVKESGVEPLQHYMLHGIIEYARR